MCPRVLHLAAREVEGGADAVTNMDTRAESGKGLDNERKGETPPNAQGLIPPKAQGWWESSTTWVPRRPKEQQRALGEGRGAKGWFPQPLQTAWP